MTSPAPPKSPDLSVKSKKYDRQIRLWGEHGQRLLECGTICLVNACGLGCEVLKGLVLPGIGGFTVVDGSKVTEEDVGTNFFLDPSCIGKNKAASCMILLQELNSDAQGDYVDESIDYILNNRPAFFESFRMVIASNLNEQTLLRLSDCLWEANIPFIYCRSLGFFGSIRLQIKEHCIVEAHPDNRQLDLRLESPYPALEKHLNNTELSSKVPWLIVLSKFLHVWRSENEQRIPRSYKEKSEIREMIRKAMDNQENYEEAIKAVNAAFGGGCVTTSLKAIFDDDACSNLNKESDKFWIMVSALKQFVYDNNDGLLPLQGVLPDMTADTESYINLQNVYRQQALDDANVIYCKCQANLRQLGLPEETITDAEVRLFCREAPGLTVVRGSKISDEYKQNSRVLSILNDPEIHGSLTEIYLAFRAYEKFLTEYCSVPGECFAEHDTLKLKVIANKILSELGVHMVLSDDIIHEICRCGGSEMHTVSSFIGGCAAQEVIKIITKQYIPVDNMFLYNAVTSETTTLKL